jgi:hypothetical protein
MSIVVTPPSSPRPPALERVTQNVVDAVRSVTRNAGGFIDLIVERPNPTNGQKIQDGFAVVIQGDPTEITEGVSSVFQRWAQPYQVQLYAIQSQDDATPVDARLNRMIADVVAAVTFDIRRGGIAMNTEANAPEFDIRDVNATGGMAIAKFTVTYETYRNNFFRARSDPT